MLRGLIDRDVAVTMAESRAGKEISASDNAVSYPYFMSYETKAFKLSKLRLLLYFPFSLQEGLGLKFKNERQKSVKNWQQHKTTNNFVPRIKRVAVWGHFEVPYVPGLLDTSQASCNTVQGWRQVVLRVVLSKTELTMHIVEKYIEVIKVTLPSSGGIFKTSEKCKAVSLQVNFDV